MDDAEYFYWMSFKLKIYEANKDAFQRLFEDLMNEKHGNDFRAVRPWQGDGGNDGFVDSTNHYMQVYGPLASTKVNPVSAANKALSDFKTLQNNWPNMDLYSFVYNDHFDQMPAPVHTSLQSIENDFGISTSPITAGTLEKWFLELDTGAKQRVLRSPPLALSAELVEPGIVGELLTHLENNIDCARGFLKNHLVPEIDDKVEFNKLSSCMASAMKNASYYVLDIDEFLIQRPGLSQGISDQMNSWYVESKSHIGDDQPSVNDIRFIYILKKLLPTGFDDYNNMAQLSYQQLALTIMSKYFETCDIYENPISINTA